MTGRHLEHRLSLADVSIFARSGKRSRVTTRLKGSTRLSLTRKCAHTCPHALHH